MIVLLYSRRIRIQLLTTTGSSIPTSIGETSSTRFKSRFPIVVQSQNANGDSLSPLAILSSFIFSQLSLSGLRAETLRMSPEFSLSLSPRNLSMVVSGLCMVYLVSSLASTQGAPDFKLASKSHGLLAAIGPSSRPHVSISAYYTRAALGPQKPQSPFTFQPFVLFCASLCSFPR